MKEKLTFIYGLLLFFIGMAIIISHEINQVGFWVGLLNLSLGIYKIEKVTV